MEGMEAKIVYSLLVGLAGVVGYFWVRDRNGIDKEFSRLIDIIEGFTGEVKESNDANAQGYKMCREEIGIVVSNANEDRLEIRDLNNQTNAITKNVKDNNDHITILYTVTDEIKEDVKEVKERVTKVVKDNKLKE